MYKVLAAIFCLLFLIPRCAFNKYPVWGIALAFMIKGRYARAIVVVVVDGVL